MQIIYDKEYLEELYVKGKCKNKKYRFAPPVVTKYQKRIDTLMAATRIEDLFVFNSLNFEALEGRQDTFSIRIDYHYRLVFKVQKQEDGNNSLTLCTIEDITNHYK
ncbi:MAG: type II toxin-antitoxin system RelE/ParE family toxin [Bacteroidaceae bacterium]|nr:type II toxin-antitoxin system RelE/ParE family toxin [Bacteroidaceae bacterium]